MYYTCIAKYARTVLLGCATLPKASAVRTPVHVLLCIGTSHVLYCTVVHSIGGRVGI